MEITFFDLDDIRNPLLGAGQAHATMEVGKRLSARGHKVSVYCSKYPGFKDRTENGLNYRHIGIGSGNMKLNNLVYILAVPFFVPKIHEGIIIECFTAPISTLLSPLFAKVPVVALPSMFNADEFVKKYHLPFDVIERYGLKYYKYIMPYSDVDSKKALKLNPNIDVHIIPQGVNKQYFSIKPEKPEYILFLSRFDMAQKGIDLLLKAYRSIKDHMKYPLVLAGHGPDEKQIWKLIKEYNLTEQVKLVGPAYGQKKYNLMKRALYTVFPSRHDEICLWTLESLASGLPIVGFDIPESKWLNSKVAIKTKPFDIELYAKALLYATKARIISKMSKESRLFAKRYTWEKVADEFEFYLTRVLRNESLTI